MGAVLSKNEFEVEGKTVVIPGGSKGMGLHAARQLAEKGANVMIAARNKAALEEAIDFISKGAKNPETQRFHQISADVTDVESCGRIIREATQWNHGNPPDIVWCAAGTSHPTLFIDTPPEAFKNQMDTNYMSCVYVAQAALKAWLPDNNKPAKSSTEASTSSSTSTSSTQRRHLIFTGSFLSFYSLAGYTAYTPSKAAIRALADTLSQEMNLYAGAHPQEPVIKIHSVYPATILTQSLEAENLIKTDMTKMLEEDDTPLKPEEVARRAIAALERGEELIATDILTRLVMCSVLGGSIRGGFFKGLVDTLLAWVMMLGMIFVRWDMDSKVRKWGKLHGPTGMKTKV